MLCIESAVLATLGLAGLFVAESQGKAVSAIGLDVTPALSWTALAVGVAAATSIIHRRLAVVFSAVVAVASVFMVIVCAVAAAHHHPGPLGFTAAATLLYAALFCANLAIGMWLIPNHIEGPTWIRRRRSARHTEHDATAGPGS